MRYEENKIAAITVLSRQRADVLFDLIRAYKKPRPKMGVNVMQTCITSVLRTLRFHGTVGFVGWITRHKTVEPSSYLIIGTALDAVVALLAGCCYCAK